MNARQYLYTLRSLELEMTLTHFEEIFPSSIAEHLYSKWVMVCKGSLVTLYMTLDIANAVKLENYIDQQVNHVNQ